ncbi:MAG: DUF1987 domain-containing protein [Desulfobacteraceae bacterium]|nr:DUF1987 domain-containing protein [Desulfobacteraceae bacterium]
MEKLDLAATLSTPKICYCASSGILELSGESYPENSFEFYAPLISWLRQNLETLQSLQVNVNMTYMNSSSVKCILDILDILKESAARGRRISINWFYDRENSRALELAEEFGENLELPFNIIPTGG